MNNTIKGFRGKDGPIRLDYSGVANVPGAIQSIAELTAQPGDHFEVETVDSTGRVATVKAVAKPGGNSGQNVALTTEQINALDGMFWVVTYDSDADYAAAYAAFCAAFGLAAPGGDTGGDDSGGTGDESGGDSGGDNSGVSNEDSWTDGVAYTYQLVENEYVGANGVGLKPYDNWSRTPYLYCAGAARLDFTDTNSLQSEYSAFYDEQQNHLSNFRVGNQTVEVPSDAVYFIVSGPDDVMAKFTATPYAQSEV